MKQKSLRQLAKELGVSASYLSQVNHGKKKLSLKVANGLTSASRSVNIAKIDKAVGADFPVRTGRTSNPSGGTNSVFGGFDSHALPPKRRITVMAKIKCPKCGFESYFSLAQPTYQGPYRCVGCKDLFTIKIENDEMKSCDPITQQDMNKVNSRKHY